MRDNLKEGEDYYLEGKRYVFTERYHAKRGFCCHGRCRHCPWNPDRPADPTAESPVVQILSGTVAYSF